MAYDGYTALCIILFLDYIIMVYIHVHVCSYPVHVHIVVIKCDVYGFKTFLLIHVGCTTDTGQWTPIPVSEEGRGSDSVWTRWFDPVRVGLMILLPPLTQVTLTMKQSWEQWKCKNCKKP